MARFYLSPEDWDSARWILEGDEAKHCARVLRLREGESCVLFDGRGHAGEFVLERVSSSHVVCRPKGNEKSSKGLECSPTLPSGDSPAEVRMVLCQAIPKGSNMDWIIQKAVELGVAEIYPLITERTITRYTDKEVESKREKWQRTALEACKQCGQNVLPIVHAPMSFDKWMQHHVSTGEFPKLRIIASLAEGARPFKPLLQECEGETQCAYLVGPEGDFSPRETALALEHEFLPVTLGDIVLRVETATFYGLSVIKFAL